MYWPMLLWQQYLFSGDETLLREMAPRLTHFLEWIKPFRTQPPSCSILPVGGFPSMPAATCPTAATTSPRPANTMKTCALPPACFPCWDKRTKAMTICGRRRKSKPASIPICSMANSISRGPTGKKCFRSLPRGHCALTLSRRRPNPKSLPRLKRRGNRTSAVTAAMRFTADC